jgi:hypothetical protein
MNTSTHKKPKLKTLLDVQLKTKVVIEDLKSEFDVINFSGSVITSNLANLISAATIAGIKGKKIKEENVLPILTKVLRSVLVLANTAHLDIPDISDMDEFEESIPVEAIRNPVLSALGMITAISDILHFIYVACEGMIWDQEEHDEEFVGYFYTLIIGIKNIALHYGLKFEDVQSALS